MSSYEEAGVSRKEADRWVDLIAGPMSKNFRREILSDVGDYGSFYEAPSHYSQPIWVATTDGVGTKLCLAEEAGDAAFVGIGQDVVAMCVNDLLACRAEPLIFLDYLATGKLKAKQSEKLVMGIIDACRRSGCSLIGGETAEMPGFYPPGRLDVAGFSVGVLEKTQRFNKKAVSAGDCIIAVPSSGFHSNGYSLIRKVMKEQSWNLDSQIEGQVLGESLLEPTKLYVNELLSLIRNESVLAAAHITGGGILENITRVYDESKVHAAFRLSDYEAPALMQTFCEAAKLDQKEAYSTWNMGIGFCLIVKPEFKEALLEMQPTYFVLGEMREGVSEPVVL